MADQETNANAAHVEAVEPRLQIKTNFRFILTSFPLKNALGDGGDGWVVPSFDRLKGFREAGIVISDLRGPIYIARVRIIPAVVNT